jgi:hypothetical protein
VIPPKENRKEKRACDSALQTPTPQRSPRRGAMPGVADPMRMPWWLVDRLDKPTKPRVIARKISG